MTRFTRQRWIGWLLLIAATAAVLWWYDAWHGRAGLPYATGWVLFAVMTLLALYNARKKLPFLPLGSSETWLQIHIYGGWLTVVLLLAHIDFRLPTGWFEGVLAALFLVVTISGFVGLYMTRSYPKRLTTRGTEIIYEQITPARHHLRQEAEALVLEAIPAGGSPVLAEFHVRRLHNFFGGPRNFWLHLADSRRPLTRLLDELDDLRRYLSESERQKLEQLIAIVRQKDALDYHFALQTALKLWLFVHVPATYSLMLWTIAHVVIVHAFSGGAP